MKIWNKKTVSPEELKELHDRFGLDPLTASILSRRGIVDGNKLMYFLEDDLRFVHNPFLFNAMEDAVDRILSAKEEGEKVLIFGDRDVDGVTSTAILYDYLKDLGIDVSYRLPGGEDSYGLSMEAIDDFAKEYGTLIITVDCGISNFNEITHANQLGIDVIVTDHHMPPENLPPAHIIINPKLPDSGYPFTDISGCAVAYKLVEALRFSETELYKQEICLMNVRPVNEAYTIECLKLRNLVKKASLSETILPLSVPVTQTRLPEFLKGQQIFVWDGDTIRVEMENIFGRGVEFNTFDIRGEVAKLIPQVSDASLLKIKDMSKIARYSENSPDEMDGFYNIFVSYINTRTRTAFPKHTSGKEMDLQLVMLAVLSDIMPLLDENRIFVKKGLSFINSGKIRSGLKELFARQGLLGKRCSSSDLSWNIIPVLNAAGRLGEPERALELFLEKDPSQCDKIAEKIISLNSKRKELVNTAWQYIGSRAEESVSRNAGKLCVIVDERIDRGVLGIVAAKLVQRTNVPSIVITKLSGTAVGSMRSNRGVECIPFLDKFGDIYQNHGGHAQAAGFSIDESKFSLFEEKLPVIASTIELGKDESETIDIDAELQGHYLTPELIQIVDKLEPYGEKNPELIFMTRNVRITDAQIMGKTDKNHLKLTLDFSSRRWPAIWWGQASKLGEEFNVGDTVNVLYNYERNTFNGMEGRQLIIKALEKAED